MGDFATRPEEALTLVVQRLVHLRDVLSFRAVCKLWNKATLPMLHLRFPLLMLPEEINEGQQISSRRKFYSLSTLQICEIKMTQAIGRKCLGTFNGWFLTVDEKRNYNANLIHPFSKEQKALPRLFSFNYPSRHAINLNSCVVKVAMSGTPQDVNNSTEKCIVVAIARDHPVLAYARINSESWTMYRNPPAGVAYYDVAYYKGAFHAVDKNGVLFICDVAVDRIGPTPREIAAPVAPPRKWKQMYLIESSGDLLLVYRTQIRRWSSRVTKNSLRRSTTGFVVYKLDEVYGIGEYRWTEAKNLRGRTLFLGGDVSVSSFSSKRAKPDCIYFSEDGPENYPGGYDTRVYNMKNKLVELLYRPRS